jgi:hypothetical protein
MFCFRHLMKIALLLLSWLLVSCASFSPKGANIVVGEWSYADSIQSCRYHFKRDGTFNGQVKVKGQLVSDFTGTWAVQGNHLLYTYVSDKLGRIPVGATDRDKLLNVQKDSFWIEAADGSRRRYSRIP